MTLEYRDLLAFSFGHAASNDRELSSKLTCLAVAPELQARWAPRGFPVRDNLDSQVLPRSNSAYAFEG
jgi:hypothetical protein